MNASYRRAVGAALSRDWGERGFGLHISEDLGTFRVGQVPGRPQCGGLIGQLAVSLGGTCRVTGGMAGEEPRPCLATSRRRGRSGRRSGLRGHEDGLTHREPAEESGVDGAVDAHDVDPGLRQKRAYLVHDVVFVADLPVGDQDEHAVAVRQRKMYVASSATSNGLWKPWASSTLGDVPVISARMSTASSGRLPRLVASGGPGPGGFMVQRLGLYAAYTVPGPRAASPGDPEGRSRNQFSLPARKYG